MAELVRDNQRRASKGRTSPGVKVVPGAEGRGSTHMETLVSSLLTIAQNSELSRVSQEKMLNKLLKEGGAKRKKEDEYKSEEKVLFTATLEVKDDSHETLCWEARNNLANPNADPQKWWTKEVKNKRAPALGSNLVMDHLMAGRVAESTAVKVFDRTETLELKNLLTKNSGHLGRVAQKIKTDYSAAGTVSHLWETDWKDVSTCWEAVEGIMNFAALLYHARSYDYMGIAMIRAGHQVRWFSGVARSPKEQATLIERWANETFVTSAQAARGNKAAPDYEEILKMAKATCERANVSYDQGLMEGDPYCCRPYSRLGGAGSDGGKAMRELEMKVRDLQGQLASGKQYSARFGGKDAAPGGERGAYGEGRGSRGGYGGQGSRGAGNGAGGRERREPLTLEQKKSFTCKAFNTEAGCQVQGCQDKHGCSKEVNGMLCWQRHPVTRHGQ